MSKKALIRLKEEPKKPLRRIVNSFHTINDGETLQSIMSYFDCEDPSLIIVDREYSFDLEDSEFIAKYSREQTDEEYEEEMKRYRERKKKYDVWYKKNKDLIEQEIQRREEKKKSFGIERKTPIRKGTKES